MKLPLGEPHSTSGLSQAKFLLSALAVTPPQKKNNNIQSREISSTLPRQFHNSFKRTDNFASLIIIDSSGCIASS